MMWVFLIISDGGLQAGNQESDEFRISPQDPSDARAAKELQQFDTDALRGDALQGWI